MHHRGVDAVGREVLEDDLGDRPRGCAAGLAVREIRPPSNPGVCRRRKTRRTVLDERLDLEVLLPDAAVAEVLGEAGDEEVGGLEDVAVGRDHEALLLPSSGTSCEPAPVPLVYRSVQVRATEGGNRGAALAATSGRVDLGRLRRRRRARSDRPGHAREGPRGRARGGARHHVLPEPAARLPGRHRTEPTAVPAHASRPPRTCRGTPRSSTTSRSARCA